MGHVPHQGCHPFGLGASLRVTSTGAEPPSPPCSFPKISPCLCLRLAGGLKLFSLSPISVCRLGAGKLNPCKESAGRAENPISSSFGRRSSSPAAPLPCDSGRRTHGPLLASETGQAARSSSEERSGKGEVFKAMSSAASEDEALGDCLSSTPRGDSTGARLPPRRELTLAES